MNARLPWCGLIAVVGLTLPAPAKDSHVFDEQTLRALAAARQQAEASVQLSTDQRAYLDDHLAVLEAKTRDWEKLAAANPGEPVWKKLADQGRATCQAIRAGPVLQDDLSQWMKAYWTGITPVAVYTGGYYYLDRQFFVRDAANLAVEKRNWNNLGRCSYLWHEYVHSQQSLWTRGEVEAYKSQYLFLAACGVPDTQADMVNVLGQLVALGVLPNATDRAALNRELGVDVVLASRTAAVATKPFRILSPGGLAGIHLTPFVGTFRDSFPAGSGGGTITLTFSDRLTAVSGACDYRSTEYVSGGNQPGTYTFVGNKYPKLHLQDGRVTGTIVWIKHYERFPSATSQNSFAVEGKIDFQTGTITGHAADQPSYTWEVKFQPIQVEPVAWGPPPPVKR